MLDCFLFSTDQNILNLIIPTFDVVEHHVLSDVFPILQLVHLVVSVRVQNGPAQELGQSLRNRKQDQSRSKLDSVLRMSDQNTSMSCSSWSSKGFPSFLL